MAVRFFSLVGAFRHESLAEFPTTVDRDRVAGWPGPRVATGPMRPRRARTSCFCSPTISDPIRLRRTATLTFALPTSTDWSIPGSFFAVLTAWGRLTEPSASPAVHVDEWSHVVAGANESQGCAVLPAVLARSGYVTFGTGNGTTGPSRSSGRFNMASRFSSGHVQSHESAHPGPAADGKLTPPRKAERFSRRSLPMR
ncbi:MAG: hypothetical protein Ct9H300mP1_21510 [Planctomycetaceae bacterium]|nr:MAG: hypothetical protein Ct9H300mP1_21510 [Planctomycetaceae bacterium]